MKFLILVLLVTSCTLYEVKGNMDQENFEKEVKIPEKDFNVGPRG